MLRREAHTYARFSVLQIRRGNKGNIKTIFIFLYKNICHSPQKNCLAKAVPMRGHNICFD